MFSVLEIQGRRVDAGAYHQSAQGPPPLLRGQQLTPCAEADMRHQAKDPMEANIVEQKAGP